MLSYLRLGNFAAALSEIQAVLSIPDLDKESKRKALYRAGQASYGQGDYISAQEWYEKCISEDSTFTDARTGIANCKRRIKEQDSGEYDWVALYKASQFRCPRLDVASYRGPIEVVPMDGRGGGRGVVSARDIKAGELLVSLSITIT